MLHLGPSSPPVPVADVVPGSTALDTFSYDPLADCGFLFGLPSKLTLSPRICQLNRNRALAGFIYGGLNPAIQEELIQHIQSIFPPPIPSQEVVGLALNTLNQDAGVLAIIAIVMAIIGGLGLFVAMEGKFAIIYQIRTRGIIQQYIMALCMLLVFVVLSPLMIFADTFPTVVDAFVQTTPPGSECDRRFRFCPLDDILRIAGYMGLTRNHVFSRAQSTHQFS